MPRVPTIPPIPGIDRLTTTQTYAAAGATVLAATLALVGTQGDQFASAATPSASTAWTGNVTRSEAAVHHQLDTAGRHAANARQRHDQHAASHGQRRPARPSGTPQQIARQMIGNEAQFQCFSHIVSHESDWKVTATNPTSGSYGLVQALPASKMASAGSDWRTNPATQIAWGLQYMNGRYGSPCAAWSFWQAHSWY